MGGDNFLLLVFADGDFLVTSCWPLHTSAGRLEPGAGHLLHWPATAAMCLPLSENGLNIVVDTCGSDPGWSNPLEGSMRFCSMHSHSDQQRRGKQRSRVSGQGSALGCSTYSARCSAAEGTRQLPPPVIPQ